MSDRGMIGYVGLVDWWDNDLSASDRRAIVDGYHPLGDEDAIPDKGQTIYRAGLNSKPVTQLRVIIDLLNATTPYAVMKKIIAKGESVAMECTNALDVHFFFASVISTEYRHRDEEEGALDRAIEACKNQISVAAKAKSKFKSDGFIPSHQGYKQLAIILEKQKKFKEAVKLCEKALKQGWSGDWEKRIERCTKKIK
ncbi:tetratricopeptide repeat protein [Serratia fonticola]